MTTNFLFMTFIVLLLSAICMMFLKFAVFLLELTKKERKDFFRNIFTGNND